MLVKSVIITNLSASRAGYPLANVKQIEEIPQKVRAKKKLNCASIRNTCRQSQKTINTICSPRYGVGELMRDASEWRKESHPINLTISRYFQQTCTIVRKVVDDYEIHSQYPT